MLTINKNYSLLSDSYLFPEIKKRVSEFLKSTPSSKIYNLGEGDTTQPLSYHVATAMINKVKEMTSGIGFMGYSDPLGILKLRKAIASYYKKHLKVEFNISELFISDGAKADLFNIQKIFENNMKVAIQDPSYPVYIDSLVINGIAGKKTGSVYNNLIYLKGSPENGFIPQLPKEKVDMLYLSFPNNPTGVMITKSQLKQYVDFALENNAIIIYDAVYSWFISDNSYPRSIYEIPEAKKCAIEIQSFSKLAGFPSVRLGWTIVPITLENKKINSGQLNSLWRRRQQTGFNGASVVVQEGGIVALSSKGMKHNMKNIKYYMRNTAFIKGTCDKLNLISYGGQHAPYVWVKTPNNMKSWDFFDLLLRKAQTICTPGIGFGPSSEGFFRLSGFANIEDIREALRRMQMFFS